MGSNLEVFAVTSAREKANSKRRVDGAKVSRSKKVLTSKTRGGKVRRVWKDEDAKRKGIEPMLKAARKFAADPEKVKERGRRIKEGIARAKKERDERDKDNPFGKINIGRTFVPIAIAFAEEVVADKKGENHGIWMRFAARRFLNDLKRAKKKTCEFTFNERAANKACRFIELLPHVEGKWATPNIRLVPAQVFFVVQLFGFRRHDGGRRFTDALLAVARKNAKSTLAAAIMLYIICEEDEPGSQIYAAATTGDQARVVWRIAKSMLNKCHALQKYYRVEPRANDIIRWESDSFFKPINAKASTQDGLNPMACVLDEVHAHKSHDLLNVLTSAAGAREDPLFLFTTTEGYETPGPWPELRAFAQNVLRGGVEADHFLALIFAIDEDSEELGTKADDDFDEAAWRKANPLYDSNPALRAAMQKLAIEAQMMPGKRPEFRIKRLNRVSASAKAWIDIARWQQCGEKKFDDEFLRDYTCWGAFDLASTRDMVAWCLLFLVEGEWYARLRYWVPTMAVENRKMRRSAPYQGWVEAGWVHALEGDMIDPSIVEQGMREDIDMFHPVKIAYDPWNAQQIAINLGEDNLDLEIFIQGPRSYHPAMQRLEIEYMNRTLHTNGNPVLQWNAANIVPRYDVNMNMAPDRKKSADKIDGMCALLMSLGIAIHDTGDESQGFFEEPIIV